MKIEQKKKSKHSVKFQIGSSLDPLISGVCVSVTQRGNIREDNHQSRQNKHSTSTHTQDTSDVTESGKSRVGQRSRH